MYTSKGSIIVCSLLKLGSRGVYVPLDAPIHLFWHFIVRHGGKPNTWHDEFISRLSSRFRFPRRFLLGGLHWPSTGRLTYTVAPSRKQKFGHAAFLSRGAASHGAHTVSPSLMSYQLGQGGLSSCGSRLVPMRPRAFLLVRDSAV